MANTKKSTAKTKTTTKKTVAKKTSAAKKPVEKKVVEVKKEEKKPSVGKIVLLIVCLVIFFIVIFALSNNSNKGKYSESTSNTTDYTNSNGSQAQTDSASITDDEMGELTLININDFLKLKAGDEASVIYIGRPTCSHCVVQKPIMQYMVYKYGIKVNYLNTDELDEEGFTKLQKSDDYFSQGWGTPLTLIVKDDEIVAKSEGETSIADLTTMFKENGIISE